MSFPVDPRAYEIRLTQTQTDRPKPPDDGDAWELVDWKPIPLPLPGAQAVQMLTVCIWAHPICTGCGKKQERATRAAWIACADGAQCPDCWSGPPMAAWQCCPMCRKPIDPDRCRGTLPHCSEECAAEAGRRRAELDPDLADKDKDSPP